MKQQSVQTLPTPPSIDTCNFKDVVGRLIQSKYILLAEFERNKALTELCKLLSRLHLGWNDTYSDKGSMTASEHDKDTAITNVYLQIKEQLGIPISLNDFTQMHPNQVIKYFRLWTNRILFDLRFRNGNLNGTYTRHNNSETPSFPRKHHSIISKTGSDEKREIILTDQSYAEAPEKLEEKALLSIFEQLEIRILTEALTKPELIFCFPKITSESIVRYLMFHSGLILSKQQTITSQYLILLEKWSRRCNFDQNICNQWSLRLPELQSTLHQSTGLHSMHIKDTMILVLNDDVGERESVRRGLNHVEKGVNLLSLSIWLTMVAPKDGYYDDFLNLTSNLVMPASQVLSRQRQNHQPITMYQFIQSIIKPNKLLRKAQLRPLLSRMVYDVDFINLSNRRANKIRMMVDRTFELSQKLSQSSTSNPFKANAPLIWRG